MIVKLAHPNQNPRLASLGVTFQLGTIGYDRERMGSEKGRLAALVNEAWGEGLNVPTIAALARLSRQTVLELLAEAA